MGSEAAVAALLVLYILGALVHTGFLAFSLRKPERRKLARKKLALAFSGGAFVSAWAAMWWQSNYPEHLTELNLIIFAFLPGLAIGTIVAEILFRIGKLYGKLRRSKA